MGARHQYVRIQIPVSYGPSERVAIAQDVIDFIRQRTEAGKDRFGDSFPGYSKAYKGSLEFKIAGKSSHVNLRLSGDMMTALGILGENPGEIKIGFDKGSDENARADGNIRGTYGTKIEDASKARDFLGVTKTELKQILRQYPLKKKERDQSKINAEIGILSGLSAKLNTTGE